MSLPRALIDANLLVSVLISSDPSRSSAAAVLAEAEARSYSLVVPAEAMEEVTRVVQSKPWLISRITHADVDRLLDRLNAVAEIKEMLEDPPPRLCRDPADDYLIAQAFAAQAEFLVTRDRDLLSLGEIAGVRIVDPVIFLEMLRSESE